MNKIDYLHEMKNIATIYKEIRSTDRRQGLQDKVWERTCRLLDIAVRYLPDDKELEA